jgi:isopentenyl-diphosphate delta-isomerase
MKIRDKVVLVDRSDNTLGEMDKLKAHQQGRLHRAFSVFIFNSNGEMLLQQRALGKYHGAGLWTNACCSHPQLDDDIEESAQERLNFELGLNCKLKKVFTFTYKVTVENNLMEHEFDHVFLGFTDLDPIPNADEVKAYKWINTDELKANVKKNPLKYTSWFNMALPKILDFYNA